MSKNSENYRDRVEDMGKRDVKALNKEIRQHYDEHGWRATISEFKIAPKDLSPLVKGDDAGKKKPRKTKAKKDKAPKKRAKKEKAANAAPPKKRGRPRKSKSATPAGDTGEVLDFLLAYRKKNQANSLDDVIIDLTAQVRGA